MFGKESQARHLVHVHLRRPVREQAHGQGRARDAQGPLHGVDLLTQFRSRRGGGLRAFQGRARLAQDGVVYQALRPFENRREFAVQRGARARQGQTLVDKTQAVINGKGRFQGRDRLRPVLFGGVRRGLSLQCLEPGGGARHVQLL